MPLNPKPNKQAISENVATERRAGKPEKQAVAIAYSEARRHGYKDKKTKDYHKKLLLPKLKCSKLRGNKCGCSQCRGR